jgi:hypothetical protein
MSGGSFSPRIGRIIKYNNMSSRKKFMCLDCSCDTGKIGEHYMLKDEIWLSIVKSNKGMLCISCLESRLGRELTPNDFNNSHINKPYPGKIFSNRLMNRLK